MERLQLLEELFIFLDLCKIEINPEDRNSVLYKKIIPTSIEDIEWDKPSLILPNELFGCLDSSILVAPTKEDEDLGLRHTVIRVTNLNNASWRGLLQMHLPDMVDLTGVLISQDSDCMTFRYAMGVRKGEWCKFDTTPGNLEYGFSLSTLKAIELQYKRERSPHLIIENSNGTGSAALLTDYIGLNALLDLNDSLKGTLRRTPLKDWAESHWMQERDDAEMRDQVFRRMIEAGLNNQYDWCGFKCRLRMAMPDVLTKEDLEQLRKKRKIAAQQSRAKKRKKRKKRK